MDGWHDGKDGKEEVTGKRKQDKNTEWKKYLQTLTRTTTAAVSRANRTEKRTKK